MVTHSYNLWSDWTLTSKSWRTLRTAALGVRLTGSSVKVFISLFLFSSFLSANEFEQNKLFNWLVLECGEKPTKVETIYKTKSKWPFSTDIEDVYFHKYTMINGTSNIGITGPVTYSFLTVNQTQYTEEELNWLYTGWFISTSLKANGNHDDELEKNTCSHLVSLIPAQEFKVEKCVGLFYKEFKYSAIKVHYEKSNGDAVIFAYDKTFGDTADSKLDFTNVESVLYYYIGREYLEK